MSKRLTVIYEVPDDYNVTRITGTGELNVVRCEWMDALERLAAAEARETTLRGLLREACEYAKADESDWKSWYPRFIPEDWCDRAQASLEGKP